MDQLTIHMAKYKKDITDKAVNALCEDKVMYALHILHILKLNDIMLHHQLYNFGVTARFKLNWINPLTWAFVVVYVISAIIYNVMNGITKVVKNIKHGKIIYFE